MSFLEPILARCGLNRPDARPLHAYGMSDDEFILAADAMKRWHSRYAALPAPLFTLWASERIRRDFGSGLLSWDFVMAPLGVSGNRLLGVDLTEKGLAYWQRPLRQRSGDGTRLFLYSLMAEGGLPDAFLSRSSGYAAVLQAVIGDYEREALGPGDPSLVPMAVRRSEGLPAALQNADSNRLLADLAMAFVQLRRDLPSAIGVDAAEAWLDRNRPGWAQALPLRLSDQARRAVLMPALARLPGGGAGADLALRLLLRGGGGETWVGAVEFAPGAVLPFALLPQADRAHVLRLATADGRMLRASPDQGGWRLDGTQPQRLRLDPWAPTILTAHADGLSLGDVVVDSGLPEPAEAPGLWRARTAGSPEVLVPAYGGRTRGPCLWVLAPEAPEAGDGVQVHPPRPGPGGMLWPISGTGEIRVAGRSITVTTGAEEDDPPARLLILAPPLREGWPAGGMPAYVGRPRFLGGEGDAPLKDVTDRVRVVPSPRVLGLHRFDWIEDGRIVVSSRAVLLPETLKLHLREKLGGLVLEVAGLPPNWRLALLDGARHLVPADQTVLETPPAAPGQGEVGIELFDREGRTLVLRRAWPTREPMLIDDAGRRMTADRRCSLPRLLGWRGVLPDRGALQLRMPSAPRPVAFEQSGMVRLAAWRPLLAQALALSGADGWVNLRMVNDSQTPRLRLARYDWAPDRQGGVYDLGPEPVSLRASTVQAPVQRRETIAQGLFDPQAWLGDVPEVWLVQGRSASVGVMRPFPFAVGGLPVVTRDQRIASYEASMAAMLAEPGHPGWSELTDVLRAARDGGDCGGLDQAQALGLKPAVAVALLFRAPPSEVSTVLDLETEAPFWWPAVPLTDWQYGLAAGLAATRAVLETAGFDPQSVASFAAQAVARSAGAILSQRPELAVHLGRAAVAVGLPPVAVLADEEVRPLAVGNPGARLRAAAMQLAARAPSPPQGTGHLKPKQLPMPTGFSAALDPLLAAPLVTAEAVLGERSLTPGDVLELLALRHADPVWFDTALPCALAMS